MARRTRCRRCTRTWSPHPPPSSPRAPPQTRALEALTSETSFLVNPFWSYVIYIVEAQWMRGIVSYNLMFFYVRDSDIRNVSRRASTLNVCVVLNGTKTNVKFNRRWCFHEYTLSTQRHDTASLRCEERLRKATEGRRKQKSFLPNVALLRVDVRPFSRRGHWSSNHWFVYSCSRKRRSTVYRVLYDQTVIQQVV